MQEKKWARLSSDLFFPGEPTEPVRRRRIRRDLEPVGWGHPQDAKKDRYGQWPYLSFFTPCGWWDLNPHDVATARF